MHQIGNISTSPECVLVDGHVLPLTAFELKVLHHLTINAGKSVSAVDLHAVLYGHAGNASESNVLQVVIGRLRKKLAAAGAHVAIHTTRTVGYSLAIIDAPSTEVATA